MKSLYLTFAFSLFIILGFSQNEPYFIIQQSNDGYNLSLKIDNHSNIETVIVNGEIIQDNKSTQVNIALDNTDLLESKTIQNLNFNNAKAEFKIEIIDKNGTKVSYPNIILNIYEELFTSN